MEPEEPSDALRIQVTCLEVAEHPAALYRVRVAHAGRALLSCEVQAGGAGSAETARADVRLDLKDRDQVAALVNEPLNVLLEPAPASGTSPAPRCVDLSFCNIDLLPVVCGNEKVLIKKRLEPLIKPNVLLRKSWCNLPLITIELALDVDTSSLACRELIQNANTLEMTVLAAYNIRVDQRTDFEDTIAEELFTCAVATALPGFHQDMNSTVIYKSDNRAPVQPLLKRRIRWESLNNPEDSFFNPKSDKIFKLDVDAVVNNYNLEITEKITNTQQSTAVNWCSFHRTLVDQTDEKKLWKRLRDLSWPIELRASGELNTLHCMAFLDLFSLLYPGERRVVVAAQLFQVNAELMQQNTGCQHLLQAETASFSKKSKVNTKRSPRSKSEEVVNTGEELVPVLGADGEPAFVLVQCELGRAFANISTPPRVSEVAMLRMLASLETAATRRHCTGRGRAASWRECVNMAAAALSRIRTAGSSEGCSLHRQLAGSRAQVELHTSLLRHAALYINDNFVLKQEYTEEQYENVLLTAHCSLTRAASAALQRDARDAPARVLRLAARAARQLRSYYHAERLLLECLALQPLDGVAWRELATCLAETDSGRAAVCLQRSLQIDPRDPLTLLSAGGAAAARQDRCGAEALLAALVVLHPTWLPGCVAAHCFYHSVEMFLIADALLDISRKLVFLPGMTRIKFRRSWSHELGDWWEPTPIDAHRSLYLDTADLLLRIRAVDLAETCLSRHLSEYGESPAYLHLLALCEFLRGNIENALCHAEDALVVYGEKSYLLALGGACMLRLGKMKPARAAYSAACAGDATEADTIVRAAILQPNKTRARNMLEELVRKKPSSHIWLVLALNRLRSDDYDEAECCCLEALNLDRRSGTVWVVMARLAAMRGKFAKAIFCQHMAQYCGHWFTMDLTAEETEELIGEKLPECSCADLARPDSDIVVPRLGPLAFI